MAMEGNVQMLGRYIPELRAESNEIVKSGTAAEKTAEFMRIFNEKFAGTAQKNLNSSAAQMKQLGNYLGDIGEAIGDYALPAINSLLGGIVKLIAPQEKHINQQDRAIANASIMKSEFNNLTNALLNLASKEKLSAAELKARDGIVSELQSKYPNYLKNLTSELGNYDSLKTSISDARGELEKYLRSTIQSAIIKQFSDQIAELESNFATNELAMARYNSGQMLLIVGNKSQSNAAKELNKRNTELREKIDQLTLSLDMAVKGGEKYGNIILPQIIVTTNDVTGAVDSSKEAFAEYYKTMVLKNEQNERDALFVQMLIKQYPQLAESLGLVKEKTKELMTDQQALSEIASAQSIIYGENVDFQIMKINEQAEIYRQMKLDEIGIAQWASEQKSAILQKELLDQNIFFKSAEAGYDQFINTLTDAELTGKERREKVWEATKNSFVRFAGELIKEYIKKQIIQAAIEKTGEAVAIIAAGVTGAAIADAYAVPASLVATASFGGAAVAGLAGITASVAATKAMAAFAEGTDYITSGKQIIMVGDNPGGRERVQVTPLSSPNVNGPSNGNTLNVYVYGNFTDVDKFAKEIADRSNLGFNKIMVKN